MRKLIADYLAANGGGGGGTGTPGLSAYQVWLNEGNVGNESDFLDSLVGASAYEAWLDAGGVGSQADFIQSLKGEKGDTGDTGQGLPPGGTTNQIPAKASDNDYDIQWVNPPANGPGGTINQLIQDYNVVDSTNGETVLVRLYGDRSDATTNFSAPTMDQGVLTIGVIPAGLVLTGVECLVPAAAATSSVKTFNQAFSVVFSNPKPLTMNVYDGTNVTDLSSVMANPAQQNTGSVPRYFQITTAGIVLTADRLGQVLTNKALVVIN